MQTNKTTTKYLYDNNWFRINVKMIVRMKHAKYANTDHEEGHVISFSLVVNKVMLKHS